jgi:outer membrane lipoprotein-sorting protein
MKLIIGVTFYVVVTFCFGFGFGMYSQQKTESDIKTCQSEFNQKVKSTSIEHGQDIPHKGKRPNRIVTECEDNKQ